MSFDEIYEMMSGVCCKQHPIIRNLYDGECGRIYEEILFARAVIAEDGESPELLTIVDGYERMMRIFSEYAYQLGISANNIL